MKKHKPQLRIALLKRLLQPLVLMLAERPVPIAAVSATATITCCRVPKWIKHDELSVTPLELVVVLRQTNFALRLIIAREEIVGIRIRQIPFTRRCRPDV